MEDLFKKIFDVNPDTRINFAQIRTHSLFSKHFPEVSPKSMMLYNNKMKGNNFKNSQKGKKAEEFVVQRSYIMKKKSKKEMVVLEARKDKIDFLR